MEYRRGRRNTEEEDEMQQGDGMQKRKMECRRGRRNTEEEDGMQKEEEGILIVIEKSL